MPLPKINLRYIRRVLRFIESGPKLRFDMRTYLDHADNVLLKEERTKKNLRALGYPECGTRACFAGWCVLLQLPKKEWAYAAYKLDILRVATQLCGFTEDEAYSVFDAAYGTFTQQLRELKSRINDVLAERDFRERV